MSDAEGALRSVNEWLKGWGHLAVVISVVSSTVMVGRWVGRIEQTAEQTKTEVAKGFEKNDRDHTELENAASHIRTAVQTNGVLLGQHQVLIERNAADIRELREEGRLKDGHFVGKGRNDPPPD